jgi:hypothetical protein
MQPLEEQANAAVRSRVQHGRPGRPYLPVAPLTDHNNLQGTAPYNAQGVQPVDNSIPAPAGPSTQAFPAQDQVVSSQQDSGSSDGVVVANGSIDQPQQSEVPPPPAPNPKDQFLSAQSWFLNEQTLFLENRAPTEDKAYIAQITRYSKAQTRMIQAHMALLRSMGEI